MKVCITGASGFIGRNLLQAMPSNWKTYAIYNTSIDFSSFLKENKINAEAVQCDLTSESSIESALKKTGNEFDLVIYLAANTNPQASVKDPMGDLQLNAVSIVNFLERIKAKRVIFMSSGAVYAGLKGKVGPGTPIQPTLPYSISKLASEQYVKFYREIRGTIGEYVILRFSGAYGPMEPARKIYTKLVNQFAIEKKNEFEVYGDGTNLIDAMYVDDAVEGLLKVAQGKPKDITLDFCMGNPIQINELVKQAAGIFGVKSLKIKHAGQTFEPIEFENSPSEMKKLFNFSPKTTLEIGLKKLAAHFSKK